MLPSDLPKWQTVYYHFSKWSHDGTIGRKRHIVTDTTGLVLSAVVHAANQHDSKAAFDVIGTLKYRFPRLAKFFADGGYRGELIDKVRRFLGWKRRITN